MIELYLVKCPNKVENGRYERIQVNGNVEIAIKCSVRVGGDIVLNIGDDERYEEAE